MHSIAWHNLVNIFDQSISQRHQHRKNAISLSTTFDKELSSPDEAVSHGNGVRQGPKARTTTWMQKLPTSETTGQDAYCNPPVNLVPWIATSWQKWCYCYLHWPLAGMTVPCPSIINRGFAVGSLVNWLPINVALQIRHKFSGLLLAARNCTSDCNCLYHTVLCVILHPMVWGTSPNSLWLILWKINLFLSEKLKWQCAILAHSQNPQQPVTLADTYLQISFMVTDIQNISLSWVKSARF